MAQTTAKDMNQYIRHNVVTLDKVSSAVIEAMTAVNVERLHLGEHSVGVTSLRLKTFATNFAEHGKLHCVNCGLEATFFAIENFTRGGKSNPHVNLYGVNADGIDVLFTHDHRVARVFGGAAILENTQVMCLPCNSRKGCEEGKLAASMGIKRKNKPKNKSKTKRYKNASI